jgi:hypothetical protein
MMIDHLLNLIYLTKALNSLEFHTVIEKHILGALLPPYANSHVEKKKLGHV